MASMASMASNLALGSLGHEARWEEEDDAEDEYEDDGGTWDLGLEQINFQPKCI